MIHGEEGDDILLGGFDIGYGAPYGAAYDWIYGDEGNDAIFGQAGS